VLDYNVGHVASKVAENDDNDMKKKQGKSNTTQTDTP
jgi:hypothetical protein